MSSNNRNNYYVNNTNKIENEIKVPFVVFGLMAINVIMFIICEVTGDSEDVYHMERLGALYIPDLINRHEYYRLFTSMFLHFGFAHLLNNMFMLGVAGSLMERAIGHGRFLLLYILSGLGGSIMTTAVRMIGEEEDNSVIAGASGAIFGIIGGLLILSIRTRGKYKDLTGRNIIIMIVLLFIYGHTATSVDAWGHAGGLMAGILVGIPVVVSCKRLKKYTNGNAKEANDTEF